MEEPIKQSAGVSDKSEVRKHYFLDQYVVIAPRRNKRPFELGAEPVSQKADNHHPIDDEPSVFEIPGEDGQWAVKVVENTFPAFSHINPKAKGAQEIVLETNRPNTPFAELSVDEIERVLITYQNRAAELRRKYKYISIFKNHGHRAGASLAHTHSQIIAIDIIPPKLKHEAEVFDQYLKEHGTSPLCDVIRWELEQRRRIVAHTRFTTTLTPYASQFALEAWVIPNRQAQSICDLSQEEVHSLADHIKGVAIGLSSNNLDFNFHLQEPIPGHSNHFYIKITPRVTAQAGFELNTDVYINPFSPEFAADWYHKFIKTPDAV